MYKEQIKKKLKRQQEIVNKAKGDGNRALQPEEQQEFDKLQTEIDCLRELEPENEETPPDLEGRGLTAEEERQRCTDIMTLCRSFDLAPDEYIRENQSVDAVREIILNGMMEENVPIGNRGIEITDEGDKYRAAAADAILMRGGLSLESPAEGARELMGMSLRDLAIESLSKDGETGLNRRNSDDLFSLLQRQFFNPSAAFPTIMDQAINKAYVEGHRTVPVTFDEWVKKGTLSDFKIHDNNYLAGPAGEFLEVPEGGELKHDLPTDAKRPQRNLKTYGRQFTMTRQAFINDDISYLSRIPAKYAASARKTQNKQVYEILMSNPAVYDGLPLFGSHHRNVIATGTGITRESVQKMLLALQTQTDEFGEAIIVRPRFIIVPVGYAFDMYTLFYSQTINTTGNTQASNPLYQYRDKIKVIEEPTLNVLSGGFGNTMPWWIVGDPSDTDFIEIDYLNGQEVPTIRRAEVPGTLGFVWDIYLDWGITVMDYRGAVRNNGTIVEDPLA